MIKTFRELQTQIHALSIEKNKLIAEKIKKRKGKPIALSKCATIFDKINKEKKYNVDLHNLTTRINEIENKIEQLFSVTQSNIDILFEIVNQHQN